MGKQSLFGWLFSPRLNEHVETSRREDRLRETCSAVERELEQVLSEKAKKLVSEANFEELLRVQQLQQERQERERLTEQFHEWMKADILKLHEQLGTGLSEVHLQRLQKAVRIHFGTLSGTPVLEERLDHCVLNYLFNHVGRRAWMDYVQVAPAELPAGTELESQFLQMSPAQNADLLLGVVEVWRHAYPDRDSELWRKTAVLGLCSGLRSRILVRAMQIWFGRDATLEDLLVSTLEAHLAQIRSLLPAGDSSSGLIRVTSELDETCRNVIPEVVWTHIVKGLDLEPEPSDAAVDPVCWMRVERSQARAQTEHQGRIFYFCHQHCLDKFLENPRDFVDETTSIEKGGTSV